MTDKTTPEKIALVVLKDQIHNYQQLYAVQPTTGHVDEALVYQEYIRADLVPAPSADEPLEDGQYRWLKIYGSWFACYIASLTRGEGNFYFLMPGYDSGFPRGDKMVEEVGPAIQPPPDQSN